VAAEMSRKHTETAHEFITDVQALLQGHAVHRGEAAGGGERGGGGEGGVRFSGEIMCVNT